MRPLTTKFYIKFFFIIQGFFGNGTICYDIDECQWDENAKEQVII